MPRGGGGTVKGFRTGVGTVVLAQALPAAVPIAAAFLPGRRRLRKCLVWCLGWEGLLLNFHHLPDLRVLPEGNPEAWHQAEYSALNF